MKVLSKVTVAALVAVGCLGIYKPASAQISINIGVPAYEISNPYGCPDGLYYPDSSYCIQYFDWYGYDGVFHPWYDRNGWEGRDISRDGRIGHREGEGGHSWSGHSGHESGHGGEMHMNNGSHGGGHAVHTSGHSGGHGAHSGHGGHGKK